MKVAGLCHICGQPAMYSCSMCGKTVCRDCMDPRTGSCQKCAGKSF